MTDVEVLREFVGWWPLEDLTLDDQPVTDGSALTLIALDAADRPTETAGTWRPGHLDEAGNVCVWLDSVDEPVTQLVYARPAPVSPEVPVYKIDGEIHRV